MPLPIIYLWAALLFIGAAPLPYGYYTLLRLVSCGLFAFAAYLSTQRKSPILPWIYGTMALLFNPVIEVHLPKEIWMLIDVGTGILVLATSTKMRPLDVK